MQPTISFCVTSCNRWYQLRETLRHNLALLKNHELVVVNYGSRDEIHTEMLAYRDDMESGKLKYFHTNDPKKYNCPKAKNLAHRIGSKEFLFNLDGDNFLDARFIEELEVLFSEHPYGVVHAYNTKVYVPGTFGRIGIHRDNFYASGGYNEGFMPMAFQDDDFILRLNYLGLPYISASVEPPRPIYNSVARKGNDTSNVGGVESYKEYRSLNFGKSYLQLLHIGAILEQNFASFRGSLNFGPEFLLDGYVPHVEMRFPPADADFSALQYKSAVLQHFEKYRAGRLKPKSE